jgi:chemotaxis protein CheC
MTQKRELRDAELDALKEVASIGAGHAATALNQLTGRQIMIDVPNVRHCRTEEVSEVLCEAESVVAAVVLHVLGDLTGQAVVLFPRDDALYLADVLLQREPGGTKIFAEMEQSSVKETANIVTAAFMNALSDFLGLMLIPSVPKLTVDLCRAVLSPAYLEFGEEHERVIIVDTRFSFVKSEGIFGRLIMVPHAAGLEAILKAVGVS